LPGKAWISIEMLGFHQACASAAAVTLEQLLKEHPGLEVVMVGLSNGAAFATGTMEQLDDWALGNVSSVELGVPFYYPEAIECDAILYLNNQYQDPLVRGELDIVLVSLMTGLLRMVLARLESRDLSFPDALHIPNHAYPWLAIKPLVTRFLDRRLGIGEQRTVEFRMKPKN
jgi:hypothetical protein